MYSIEVNKHQLRIHTYDEITFSLLEIHVSKISKWGKEGGDSMTEIRQPGV